MSKTFDSIQRYSIFNAHCLSPGLSFGDDANAVGFVHGLIVGVMVRYLGCSVDDALLDDLLGSLNATWHSCKPLKATIPADLAAEFSIDFDNTTGDLSVYVKQIDGPELSKTAQLMIDTADNYISKKEFYRAIINQLRNEINE